METTWINIKIAVRIIGASEKNGNTYFYLSTCPKNRASMRCTGPVAFILKGWKVGELLHSTILCKIDLPTDH